MEAITSVREAVLYRTANALLDARRTGVPVANLTQELRPASEAEAFAVQDIMMRAYGEVGGWKIGARSPESVPFFAPMPAAWMGENGALFRGLMHRLHGVEAEVAFRMGCDLPVRQTAYSREEVLAAIVSCHPAIEILESAYTDPLTVARETMLADLQMHGGFVAGPLMAGWRDVDWSREPVTLTIDAVVRAEMVGSNPGGPDLVRLLVYLANEGAARTGGLRTGQWVTTGSWTGVTWATAGAAVMVEFAHAGGATLQFAS